MSRSRLCSTRSGVKNQQQRDTVRTRSLGFFTTHPPVANQIKDTPVRAQDMKSRLRRLSIPKVLGSAEGDTSIVFRSVATTSSGQ